MSTKKNKNRSKRSAFSLIEIAIVLFIISIIAAGVTASSRMIDEFRLKTAQNQSNSSPINSIRDVSSWFDSVNNSSFGVDKISDGDLVGLWGDGNVQSGYKSNAAQSNDDNKPIYVRNCLNSLPCLRFQGNDFFEFDGRELANSNYTIFVVEQKAADVSNGMIIGGTSSAANEAINLGYDSATLIFGHFGNSDGVGGFGFGGVKVPRIIVHRLEGGVEKTLHINNSLISQVTSGSGINRLVSNNQAFIAKESNIFGDTYYSGEIFEVIIFSRALKSSEIDEIYDYLSKKWKIS